jgi:hypothetical protein
MPAERQLRIGVLQQHVDLKVKLKLSHYTPRRRLEGEEYNCYSFSTSVLVGGEWSASRPCRALAQGKGPPVPIVQEAEWAPEPVWTQRLEEKSFCFCRGSNLDRPVIQPVARQYSDGATRLTHGDLLYPFLNGICNSHYRKFPANLV